MASGQNWECQGNAPAYYCQTILLEFLPGFKTLDGTQWGGITKNDLVIGWVFGSARHQYSMRSRVGLISGNRAVNSFQANGQKNGGTPPADPSSDSLISSIQDNGIRAAGIINIPVCTAKEATDNWSSVSSGKKKSAHYPCN